MNRLNYLLQADPIDIKLTWAAGGAVKANNDTLIYNANTIYLIDAPVVSPDNEWYAELAQALIFCTTNYVADGEADDENADYPKIRWTTEQTEDGEIIPSEAVNLDGYVSVFAGVALPHFRVLLDGKTCQNLGTINSAQLKSFKPFGDNIATSPIQIDDDELKIILGETGVPFLDISELEVCRDDILNICVKPALQEYYAHFPIIVNEKNVGTYGINSEFKIEMPPFAFGANAFFTIGGVNGSSGQLSVFHYYAGEILGGGIPSGGGGSFGRGVQYLGKSVPGFTGREHGGRNAMLDNMAARQAMQNKFRRERIQKIKENGKLYIQGYSTTQGMLNVQWYLWSPDWSLIDFENLKEVRDLTKAYILRNLGMLRAIISPNAEGKIDFSLYNTRADTLEERVYKRWNTTTENLKYAIARGGL